MMATTARSHPRRNLQPLQVAPIGPPPLCSVPRGYGYLAGAVHAPWHWGMLYPMLDNARAYAEHLGRPMPVTWGDVVNLTTDRPGVEPTSDGRVPFADTFRRIFMEAGVKLDEAPPSNIEELAALCHEWVWAEGRFEDGCRFSTPEISDTWVGYTYPTVECVTEAYRAIGSPLGDRDVDVYRYFDVALRGGYLPEYRHRWDGQRFVPIEEGAE